MDLATWSEGVPAEIRGDVLWRVEAYRVALFVGDIGWRDVSRLAEDRRTRGSADQLCRALGSVSANIAEGYSRGSARERAHFYEYSLGSAREARDWYFKGRHVLGEELAQHRIHLLTQVIRLLLAMIPDQRGGMLREEEAGYDVMRDA